MDYEFIFTIIALDNAQDIASSLINQDMSFKDNVQLIIRKKDDLDYKKEYPDNILAVDEFDSLKADDIKGQYVNVTSCVFEESLGEVRDFIQNAKPDLIRIDYDEIIDLDKDYRHPLLKADSTFIKSCLVDEWGGDFDVFLNEKLLEVKKCSSIPVRKSESPDIESYRKLIDDSKDPFIQYGTVMGLSQAIISKECQSKAEICDILDDIDLEYIKKQKRIDNLIRKFMIYLKTGDFHCEIKKDKLYLKTADTVVNGLHGHKINVDIVDIRNDHLLVSGVFRSSCDPDYLDYDAVLTYDDGSTQTITASKYEYQKSGRARINYLGVDWKFSSCFDFKIPLKNKGNFKIDFALRFHQDSDEMTLYPALAMGSVCSLSKYCNYLSKNSKIVVFKDNSFYLFDESFPLKAKLELKSVFGILKSGEKDSLYSIFIRIVCWLVYPLYARKRIWLFIDRTLKADDNAEHLFKYAVGQNDGVKKYFILDRNSVDFDRMKKISKNVVDLNSFKYKILCIYAEKYISSHNLQTLSKPFYDNNQKLFSNLTISERCFLQHGVTIHDVAHWLIKFRHNFVLIVTASDLERESMTYPNLNYEDDVIQTLGFPRYDNLSNEDMERQILFAPTWRKHITNDEEFLKSKYYKMISGLFSNSDLMDFLDKNGFKIMFKPHWDVIEYLHLLDIPPQVELCTYTPYQELLNKSMLLITDYSSVSFDFSYLKKPVIYYGRDDEYHNVTGYFDFEKMGFGEIIDSESKLIDKIKQYWRDDFKIEDKYSRRVDDFFRFRDRDNCMRVYDWLLKN